MTRWPTSATYSTIKRASDGEVVAGLGELPSSAPAEVPASWVIYFMMEDCDASVAKAAKLGASVDRQPFDTPFGRMATVTGPQGEVFSLMQAPPGAGTSSGGLTFDTAQRALVTSVADARWTSAYARGA